MLNANIGKKGEGDQLNLRGVSVVGSQEEGARDERTTEGSALLTTPRTAGGASELDTPKGE